ncbi:hypothetical protein Mp_7g02570 [Marchantia polymorpha subsp. ruderalis]|uniref:Uncharacterized protein n=2 Tax=Marchantia polymorpha TaxID=3197 RepID=A0AAF6BVF2_MARPO|nr:hypothetical protein MARPO_0088s0031 [Marchantia polymorpha]BBN15986.1 hypothetical protein Mp_7g02570 [Marchantia polymorpha subsp. ruderalis]|eukprot:PTQ33485.1 hypothetical protein MARPO_0088s0031 [Marchantia polymorpha]
MSMAAQRSDDEDEEEGSVCRNELQRICFKSCILLITGDVCPEREILLRS